MCFDVSKESLNKKEIEWDTQKHKKELGTGYWRS
jgi:hypothetical protein